MRANLLVLLLTLTLSACVAGPTPHPGQENTGPGAANADGEDPTVPAGDLADAAQTPDPADDDNLIGSISDGDAPGPVLPDTATDADADTATDADAEPATDADAEPGPDTATDTATDTAADSSRAGDQTGGPCEDAGSADPSPG
jgi:hypothetical protein